MRRDTRRFFVNVEQNFLQVGQIPHTYYYSYVFLIMVIIIISN